MPLRDAEGLTLNSSFALPPVRFSIATKSVGPFSAPASVPVRSQALAASGPTRVSRPAPPSIWPLIESEVCALNRSSPVPPVRF
jgi:hypothetical protein